MMNILANRKPVVVLVVLCALWAGLIAWRLLRSAEPARVPLTNVSGRSTAHLPLEGKAENRLHLNLDLLAASRTQREATFSTPRNIFAPLGSQGGSPDRGKEPPLPEAEDTTAQQQTGSLLAQFRYLGYVEVARDGRKGRQMALLSKNDELHVVKAGETIEQGIYVKSITPDMVTLRDTVSRHDETLPILDVGAAQ